MNQQNQEVAFPDAVKLQLTGAGLGQATLLNTSPEGQPFGDAAIVFGIDGLLLRVVRERGQAFLEVAAASAPTEFQQYDDVEIAMGWKSIDQVLGKREPEDLGAVFARVHARLGELRDAFSGNRAELTRARVERAARERGKAFTDRLRGKK
jgi:hypothetical protein